MIISGRLTYKQVLDLEDETDAKAQELRDKYPLALLDFHYDPDHNIFLLSRIEIESDKQGQGFGKAVMKELMDYAKSKGIRVALTPVPFHPLNDEDNARLRKFYEGFGFKKNRNKNINEDMIVNYRDLIKKKAAQEMPKPNRNDMGTTTKNVRQWTEEDVPLESEADKERPVKKLTKADLFKQIKKSPLVIGDKVKITEQFVSSRLADAWAGFRAARGTILYFPTAQLARVKWSPPIPYEGNESNIFIANIERA